VRAGAHRRVAVAYLPLQPGTRPPAKSPGDPPIDSRWSHPYRLPE